MIPAFSQVCVLTLILWSLCVCECNCVGIFPIHTFHPIPPTISPPFPPSPLWHAIFLTDNPSWPVLGQCVCVGIVPSLSTHPKLLKTTSYTYPAKAFSKRELFLKTNSKIEGFGIFLKIESSSPSGPILLAINVPFCITCVATEKAMTLFDFLTLRRQYSLQITTPYELIYIKQCSNCFKIETDSGKWPSRDRYQSTSSKSPRWCGHPIIFIVLFCVHAMSGLDKIYHFSWNGFPVKASPADKKAQSPNFCFFSSCVRNLPNTKLNQHGLFWVILQFETGCYVS